MSLSLPRGLRALWARVRGHSLREPSDGDDEVLLRWGPTVAPRSLTSVDAIRAALRPLGGPLPPNPSPQWRQIMEGRQASRWRDVITFTSDPRLLGDLPRLLVEEAVVTGPKLWTMLMNLWPEADAHMRENPAWDTPEIQSARERWRCQVVANWVAPLTEGSPAAQHGYQDHAALQQVAQDTETPPALIDRLINAAGDERVPTLSVQVLIQIARRATLRIDQRVGILRAIGRDHAGSPLARIYGLHALLQLESWRSWCQEPALVEQVLALTHGAPQLWWCVLHDADTWPAPLWDAWRLQTDRIATEYPEVAALRLQGLSPAEWVLLPAGVLRWALLHSDRALRLAALKAAGHIESSRIEREEERLSPSDAAPGTEEPPLVAQHERGEERPEPRGARPLHGGHGGLA